jgi:hypothetical protein
MLDNPSGMSISSINVSSLLSSNSSCSSAAVLGVSSHVCSPFKSLISDEV